jgi:hypothetical protein
MRDCQPSLQRWERRAHAGESGICYTFNFGSIFPTFRRSTELLRVASARDEQRLLRIPANLAPTHRQTVGVFLGSAGSDSRGGDNDESKEKM